MANTVKEIIEEVQSEMCDKYCKWPLAPILEGKNEGWLYEDDGPCEGCPLQRLM